RPKPRRGVRNKKKGEPSLFLTPLRGYLCGAEQPQANAVGLHSTAPPGLAFAPYDLDAFALGLSLDLAEWVSRR
ncbi:MAG TPA: hypothetical protein VJ183_04295, partial [Chloroflexia bacterium]|nr:hypothetical protein [Chloroflexia bacterium]